MELIERVSTPVNRQRRDFRWVGDRWETVCGFHRPLKRVRLGIACRPDLHSLVKARNGISVLGVCGAAVGCHPRLGSWSGGPAFGPV